MRGVVQKTAPFFVMRRILYIAFAAVLCGMVSSCAVSDNESYRNWTWDIAPISPMIYLSDSDGIDMLSPADSLLDFSKVCVEFRGETYHIPEWEYGPDVVLTSRGGTKSDQMGLGLDLTTDSYGKWILSFGDLDGTVKIDNEDLVINWGDGTSNTITIYNDVSWEDERPVVDRKFYIDGKMQVDIAVFKFVK